MQHRHTRTTFGLFQNPNPPSFKASAGVDEHHDPSVAVGNQPPMHQLSTFFTDAWPAIDDRNHPRMAVMVPFHSVGIFFNAMHLKRQTRRKARSDGVRVS